MNEDVKPRKIKAERVDVYQKRHNVEDAGAYPNECFILITDNKESIFVGENKELLELEPTMRLMDEMAEALDSEACIDIKDPILEKYKKFKLALQASEGKEGRK